MLPLDQLYALSTGGGIVLSRFTAAVKKRAFAIADEVDHTTPRWILVQTIARANHYQKLASHVIDYAISQAGNPLSETGAEITDVEIEAIVATYLPRVVALIA